MTARSLGDPPVQQARPPAAHRWTGVRWLSVLRHLGKWFLIWYLLSVCLAFYPFDLVWQMASGVIGFALWLSITGGALVMLARDLREDLRRSRLSAPPTAAAVPPEEMP